MGASSSLCLSLPNDLHRNDAPMLNSSGTRARAPSHTQAALTVGRIVGGELDEATII